MVVSKVPQGILRIVSDSEINVSLFYKKRRDALGSANGELWRLIFQNLDDKPLTLKLYWVPGHLDTDVSKVKEPVPDVHFALNFLADHFAGLATYQIDHPMNIASGVLHFTSIVQKVQRRFVRVLISNVEKMKYEKKFPNMIPKPPSLDDLVLATSHNLEISSSMFRCLDCSGAVSRTSTNVKNWLKAKCSALPYDDRQGLVPIPKWHLIQIGNTVPHSTHDLHTQRGIVICKVCGAIGV
jgi:hypothetical protein